MRLILLRHGLAKSKRRWDGPDAKRPLTAHGVRQAEALATSLARHHPTEIISSPSLRCLQTVGPLAARTATPVQQSKALGVDAGARALRLIHKLVTTRPADSTIVLCTHREVLDKLPALVSDSEITLAHRPPGAKGSYWALRFQGGHLVDVKYRSPRQLPPKKRAPG